MGLILAVVAVISGVALASVSGFSPTAGTVAPGGSTSTGFSVDPPPPILFIGGTSCVTATVSPSPLNFTVSLDPATLCVDDETTFELTVTARANAAPGNYVVTITEVELGGSLLGSHQWPFTVVGPTTTTSSTTSTSTTTTLVATTSTATSGTTTVASPPTTVAGGPGTSAGEGPGGSSPSPSTDPDRGTSTPSVSPTGGSEQDENDLGSGGGGPAGATPDPARGPDAEGPAVASGRDGSGGASPSLTSLSLTNALRQRLESTLPTLVTDVVLSPLVIAEILFRSLAESLSAFILPVVLVTLLAIGLILKLREEVDRDLELSVLGRE